MSASDMYEALRARQVKGTSAVVCKLDQVEVQELQVNRIANFSAFHNFSYEEDGLRVVKAYGIGGGRLSFHGRNFSFRTRILQCLRKLIIMVSLPPFLEQ